MADAHTDGAGPPPVKLMIRTKTGMSILKLGTGEGGGPSLLADDVMGEPRAGDMVEFSSDGTLAAIISFEDRRLRVVRIPSGEELWSVEGRPIQALSWSPKGTYLVTWERPRKESAGSSGAADEDGGSAEANGGSDVRGNLLVWSMTGEPLAGFSQKTFKKTDWPNIQWTADEALAFKHTANEIQVHSGDGLGAPPVQRLPAEKVASFSLAPVPTTGISAGVIRLALFYPEIQGKPASVRVHEHGPHLATSLAAKSFYKAQEAHLRWSPNGQAVLIHTHTDVDTSGASYYGSTGLYLVHGDGSYEATVPLPKEGPISDAQWAPSLPAQFVVIAGRMPSAATLYSVKGEPIFEFGQAHRNTLSFSPHGRFLLIAGFGNLAGEMDFWDRNKQKLLGRNTSHCSVGYGWSPCGRWFMTATLAPRMNVDNAVKLFKYNGAGPMLTAEHDNASLYDAQFLPAALGTYPDRPASPTKRGEESVAAPPPPQPKPKAVYRPPNASGELAAMLRAERQAGTGPKKVTGGGGGAAIAPQGYIPGFTPVQQDSKAAKNKARKEKRKAAKASESTTAADGNSGAADSTNGTTKPPDTTSAATAAAAVEVKSGGSVGGGTAEIQQPLEETGPKDAEKQIKALNKKLKQIEELKKRQGAGEKLNADQKEKKGTIATVPSPIMMSVSSTSFQPKHLSVDQSCSQSNSAPQPLKQEASIPTMSNSVNVYSNVSRTELPQSPPCKQNVSPRPINQPSQRRCACPSLCITPFKPQKTSQNPHGQAVTASGLLVEKDGNLTHYILPMNPTDNTDDGADMIYNGVHITRAKDMQARSVEASETLYNDAGDIDARLSRALCYRILGRYECSIHDAEYVLELTRKMTGRTLIDKKRALAHLYVGQAKVHRAKKYITEGEKFGAGYDVISAIHDFHMSMVSNPAYQHPTVEIEVATKSYDKMKSSLNIIQRAALSVTAGWFSLCRGVRQTFTRCFSKRDSR